MKKKDSFQNYRKKGNAVFETLIILFVILAFSLITIFGYTIFKDFNADIVDDDILPASEKAKLTSFEADYPSIFDYVSLFILIIFTIGGMVSAFMIDTNPIFFVVTIVLLLSTFVLAAYLNNIFFETLTPAEIEDFPITTWLFDNLIKVIAISGLLITLSLFAKSRT